MTYHIYFDWEDLDYFQQFGWGYPTFKEAVEKANDLCQDQDTVGIKGYEIRWRGDDAFGEEQLILSYSKPNKVKIKKLNRFQLMRVK
jgi:hypothetical protein